ncbi:NAD(P)H-quinone oxidoreductase [Tetragenococcus halophilus]|uniref:NAD(P)H-quinone oxidoreductase n=1 Tax=Tetragenococcus halophilus TaxID=51669 RepID=UPI00295EE344|nr:NAD(P)H-quinone oxidoreductase [Tetragenococcus halophilus]
MKAWSVQKPGGSEQLTLVKRQVPTAENGELLVEVSYAGINRLDILTRENPAMQKPYPILGVEVSGVVKENHSDNPSLEPGTKVAGLVKKDAYAEYAIIPAGRAIILPEEMSLKEGAAIPEVFLTAYQTMYWLGKLQTEETILIHAGASGVGTAAIQMARKINDARIIVTAGSQEKLDFCRELGADVTINYKKENFDEIVQKETDGQGADVILDFIGATYWHKNVNSVAVDARWIFIGTLGGVEVEHVDLSAFLGKRISFIGTGLSPRSDDYKAALAVDFQKTVIPYFQAGKIKPIIHQTYAFADVAKAHQAMENSENIGKLLIKVKDA